MNKLDVDTELLRKFIGVSQLHAIADALILGEESDFFTSKLEELTKLVRTMPKTYEQDGKGDDAVVVLHYFTGGMDWYITEKDMIDDDAQHQAFGLADLGYGGELGYISIQELIDNGVELDLYWEPKTLREVKAA